MQPNDWKTLLEKTAAMLFEMGKDNPLKPMTLSNYSPPSIADAWRQGQNGYLGRNARLFTKYFRMPSWRFCPIQPTPSEMVNMDRLAYELKFIFFTAGFGPVNRFLNSKSGKMAHNQQQ